MKKLLAIYLVFFKGYSVVRFSDMQRRDTDSKQWGACNRPMDYNYGHNGAWAEGDTAFEAVVNCYEQAKAEGNTF